MQCVLIESVTVQSRRQFWRSGYGKLTDRVLDHINILPSMISQPNWCGEVQDWISDEAGMTLEAASTGV